MKNFVVVNFLERKTDLYEQLHNFLLFPKNPSFFPFIDLSVQISTICEFHDDAQTSET